MARKPPVKLPDVFAKPGQAPSRGTPIEALPRGAGGDDAAAPVIERPAGGVASGAADALTVVKQKATSDVPMTVTTGGAEGDNATPSPTVTPPSVVAVPPVPEAAMTVTQPAVAAEPVPDSHPTVAPRSATVAVVPPAEAPMTVSAPAADSAAAAPEPVAQATVTPPAADDVAARPATAVPTTVTPQAQEAAPVVRPAVTPQAEAAAIPAAASPSALVEPSGMSARDGQPAAWARASSPALTAPAPADPEPPKPVAKAPPAEAPRPAAAPPSAHVPPPAQVAPHPGVTIPPPRGPAWTIAMVALGVSLTTPFWYEGALRVLGITTALNKAQQQDALAITQQERALQDVQQRLTTANAQLSKARTDLTEASRKQDETAAWTRIMILVRLSETLRRGTPFVAEVAMVRSSAAATGDLQPLVERVAPYATIGVPTAVDLANDFRRVTDPVLRPNRGFNPMAWAATVVAWTPFGRTAADTDPGRIALREAGARMQAGRINEAVAILRPVTGPVGDLMAGWLADTEARAAADALGARVDALLRATRR